MGMQKVTLFPDYMFKGKLEIPSQYLPSIKKDIDIEKNNVGIETPYGWTTQKQRGLRGEFLKKVTFLIGNVFSNETKRTFDLSEKRIDIIEPYLISIKPGHSYQINIERTRWYNACVWLQTTNKGSKLLLENFNPKRWVGPPDIAEYNYQLIPQENQLAFWPSHVPWGFTTNESMTDTVLLIMTINIPNRDKT